MTPRLFAGLLTTVLTAAMGEASSAQVLLVHEIDLEPGDFLHAIVMQDGVDAKVRLVAPSGQEVRAVDSPNGDRGPEELLAIVQEPGRFRIEITASTGLPEQVFLQSVEARQPTGDDLDRVTADQTYHRGRQRTQEGSFHDAAADFRAALGVFERLGLGIWEGHTLHGLCRVLQRQGEWAVAVVFCDRAAELYREAEDLRRAAVVLNRTGFLHLRLGHPVRALHFFEDAVPLFDQSGFVRGTVLNQSHLATAYRNLGQVRRALEAVRRAEEQAGSIDPSTRADIFLNLADVLLALHQSEMARARYAAALELYQELERTDRIHLALRGLADATARLGEPEKAALLLTETLAGLDGAKPDRWTAWTRGTLGLALRRAGRYDESHRVLKEALASSLEAGDSWVELFVRIELGHVLTRIAAAPEGLFHLDLALDLARRLGEAQGETSARARSAETLLVLGRPAEAWQRLEPALDQIEAQRAETDRSDLRSRFFDSRQDYFEIAIEALMHLHALDPEASHHYEAFRVHERRLAREITDQLAASPREAPRLSSALRNEERGLAARLRKLAALPEEIPGRTEQIDRILEELHQIWADIATIPRIAPGITVDVVQDLLDVETLLLAYSLGEARSYVWAISMADVRVYELAPRQHLERLAGEFSALAAASIPFQEDMLKRSGKRLSQAILAPVADLLDDRRLVVVPAGDLRSVPFAALPDPALGGDPLIRERELVVLPSVSSLHHLRRADQQQPRRRRLAIFADPAFTDWPRLPASGEEARAILALAPSAGHLLATGVEANRERFLSLSGGSYQVLHLATHTEPDPDWPELTGIVLSEVDARGLPVHSRIRSWEIARLTLPFELVNLSACRTLGGSTGLARAFLLAGASRVIGSLWEVGDQPTSRLMQLFYASYLNRGQTAAAALREAQLVLLADSRTRAPRSWAGFVLQGDWLPSERTAPHER